ncbi:uncharacterized protein LOC141908654 [Tubulanus polymorphus]|uniref:uncharacterized protein LOC141908654 n=1 Tax=Tubulanus polymorphus TaxID=672921 RepID=UPI003DA4B03B
MTHLNWLQKEYFFQLMRSHDQAENALEMLVDDLHADKERTIQTFLCHAGSEDFLWALIRLLGNENARVAGNSAYIIGTVAESEIGCYRVLRLTQQSRNIPTGRNVLDDLTKMLTFDDAESVMNAAGTIGTLAETPEGRDMIIEESCLSDTIKNITDLLLDDNVWTASNAALVLARLTICEAGCSRILDHLTSDHILVRLIQSLGIDEAGRGMNAAFAIGRLCDLDVGRSRLLTLSESERMISSLVIMLASADSGASKNACFALSCLATTADGHSRILDNNFSNDVVSTLCSLLRSDDPETAWFAAMTIRTLASQPRGCIRLRDDKLVLQSLNKMLSMPSISPDLKDEVELALEILKKLEKPSPPSCEVTGSESVVINWDEIVTKSGLKVSYRIMEVSHCNTVWVGDATCCKLEKLKPYTSYTYRLRAHTAGDDSPLSDPVTVTTDESAPSEVQNLHIAGCTTTQLKVMWEPPENRNGVLKGYYVYKGNALFEQTYEQTSIITGLPPSTVCEIYVCASTNRGKGPRTGTTGMTNDTGAHAPAKPNVSVLGRHEVHVSWDTPENPLGKINRYDLSVNGKVVYSGTDLAFNVRRLNPDTEYTFMVSAITNEGKCESKPTKKRTSKDEYEGHRQPLYTSPKKDESGGDGQTDIRRTPSSRSRRRSSLSQDGIKQALSRIGSAQKSKSQSRPTFIKDDSDRRSSLKSQQTNLGTKSPKLIRPHSPTPSSVADESRSSSRSKSQTKGQHQSTSATVIVPVEDPDDASGSHDPDHVSAATRLQTYETTPIRIKVTKRKKSSKTTSSEKQRAGIVTQMFDKSGDDNGHLSKSLNSTLLRQHDENMAAADTERERSVENLSKSAENFVFDISNTWSIDELEENRVDSSQDKQDINNEDSVADKNNAVNRGKQTPQNNAQRAVPHSSIVQNKSKQQPPQQRQMQFKVAQTYSVDERSTLVRSLTSVSIKEGVKPPPRLTYSMKQHPRRMSDSLYAQPSAGQQPFCAASSSMTAVKRRFGSRRKSSLFKPPPSQTAGSNIDRSYNNFGSKKHQDSTEMTRSFTTMNLRQSNPGQSQSAVSSSTSSLSKPILPTTNNHLKEMQLQRTNTFICTHRPARKNLSRYFNPLSMSLLNGLPNQWKPDFPLAQSSLANTSKFVPMQFRTQPANLPSASQTQQSRESESETMMNQRQSKFTSQVPLDGTPNSKPSYGQQKRYYHGNRLSENVPS